MIKLDSHVDTLHQIFKPNNRFVDLSPTRRDLQVDIPKLLEGGINSCFFALFIKQFGTHEEVQIKIEQQYDLFLDILAFNPELVECLSPADIYQVGINNKIGITLALENAFSIGNDLGYLTVYKEMGVRYITLCHNYSNQICDSSTDTPFNLGLSEFGKEVVHKMNQLGLMIDISHASDKTVKDVLEITNLPIIASHSNCNSIWPHPRNLTDSLIDLIAENNGVIQTTLLPRCVGNLNKVKDLVNHIDYLVRRVGINHVGIGSDFDGGGGLIDCKDMSQMNNITTELQNHGYVDEEINKIWGLNFLRVYEANYQGD